MKIRELSSRSFVILGVVIVAVITLSSQSVCADGKYFPEKAYKVAPAIPSQRAILVYKDRTEKLTIESALDGPGHSFGWIIPLPSRPTEFEKVSPGLIKTMSLVVQPKIVHDLTEELGLLWRVAVFITLCCLIVVAARHPKRIPKRILLLIWVLIAFLFLFTSHLGRHAFRLPYTDTPGIRVYDIQEIGSYELAVLEADSPDALDKWLGANGFAGITEKDETIVSDYIGNGWCFVAAKLRREGDGYSRPHPLSMSFASDKPIYPVRLTATTGSDVYLELFVIADSQAVCDELPLEVSDTYRLQKKVARSSSGRAVVPSLAGKTYRQNIGHPSASKLMWDGCVLSRLCGTLDPKQMSEDIVLRLKVGEAYQKRYYSRRGARETGLALCLRIWCILPVVLTVFFYRKAREPSGKSFVIKRVFPATLLFSFIVWGVTYVVLPKTNVMTLGGTRGSSWIRDHVERQKRTAELSTFAEEHDHFIGMSKDRIAKLLADYFTSKDLANAYTAEPIKHEDSPGNYTIFEDERGIVCRTYSIGAYPDDFVLTSPLED